MISQGLSVLATSAQLELMDKLRVLDISKYVEFPQIAVVGDQSCGKSSILESISRFAFPRDSGLCTRNVTQFIFRTADDDSLQISIIPGPNRTDAKSTELRGLRVEREGMALSNEDFLNVFTVVCEHMEIPGPGEPLKDGQSAFSEDILCVQINGPSQPNLSMVDIPGLFREAEEGKTTEQDIALVRRLMYRHISDDRTIILAVIPANVDVATQEILRIAKEVDPKGIRTLGVLTKPDLVDKGGEGNVMSLIQGNSVRLKLGWCICRNRGQAELSLDSAMRDKNEVSFFSETKPWSSLNKSRVGTPALQQRLRELLIDMTRREYPKVKSQITNQLLECRKKLNALGDDRDSPEQQREFLQRMAQTFQDLTTAALDTQYARDKIFVDNCSVRLATINVAFVECFTRDLDTNGHTVSFTTKDDKDEDEEEKQGEEKPNLFSRYANIPGLGKDDLDEMLDNWPTDVSCVPYPELFNWLEGQSQELRQGDIMDWIRTEYKAMRGFGLATIGPSILPTLFKEQSKNWQSITGNYLGHVCLSVDYFIREVMEHVCPDDQIRENVMGALGEEQQVRYAKAVEDVKFSINLERNGTLLTANHYFNDNLQKCRARRIEKLVKPISVPAGGDGFESFISVPKLYKAMDNADHTIQDIKDILQSYYKVARKRFVDNICMRANYLLLCGPDTPLRVFNTSFINNLSDHQLDMIAGEDAHTRQVRKTLKEEIVALEEGKALLNS